VHRHIDEAEPRVLQLITSVSSLRHSPSLRELDISYTKVTAAGTTGLDEIGTLQCLKAGGALNSMLPRCAAVDHCARSTWRFDVTDAVLAALADVSTLETLKLSCCRSTP
jgi:hypothetical protein